MSAESRELYLFAVNDNGLYRQRILPIIANLKKKIAKGIYDPTLALKLWKYAADDAAQRYTKEFDNGRGYGIFTPTMRRETAKELQDYYEEHLREKTNPRRRARLKHPVTQRIRMSNDVLRSHAASIRPVKRVAPKRRVLKPRYKINPKSVDCVVLKGATTGKVYARLLNSTTTMADMKAMARVIAARYKEAVTATRTKVTP